MVTQKSNRLKKNNSNDNEAKKRKLKLNDIYEKYKVIIDLRMSEIANPDFMKKLQNIISSVSTHQSSIYSWKIFDFIGFISPYT